ncbi:hypothetical protein [Cryptosporidium hominis TU502]|uniref:hypothetical protein n=1 Tax=Cryptosporidium hominis (strain TU502) TaxID=353151 RepID=UPI0000452EE8|nr:hypothetical protein [Cryptosporidium hominis TU502]
MDKKEIAIGNLLLLVQRETNTNWNRLYLHPEYLFDGYLLAPLTSPDKFNIIFLEIQTGFLFIPLIFSSSVATIIDFPNDSVIFFLLEKARRPKSDYLVILSSFFFHTC